MHYSHGDERTYYTLEGDQPLELLASFPKRVVSITIMDRGMIRENDHPKGSIFHQRTGSDPSSV